MKNLIIILLIPILSGCGTLIHGTSQNITLNSNPEGAIAKLSNGYEAVTPETISLARNKEYIVTFEKSGYKTKQTQITRDFNAGVSIFGNILWLLVGNVVDLISGGAWTLKPEVVSVTLTPNSL